MRLKAWFSWRWAGGDNPTLDLEQRVKNTKKPAVNTFEDITLHNWEERWPKGHNVNIAIRTGPESGVVGIDIGAPKENYIIQTGPLKGQPRQPGTERWAELVAENGTDWLTATVRTGRGGVHKYALHDGPAATLQLRTNVGKDGAGIDIRSVNGYCVAPPSALPGAGTYKWVEGWRWTA